MSTSNDKSLYRFVKASERLPEKDCMAITKNNYNEVAELYYKGLAEFYPTALDKYKPERRIDNVYYWLEKVEADQQETAEGSEAWVSAELLPEEKELINEYRRARLSVRKGEYSLAASRIEHCKIIIGNADDYANDKTNIPELL